MELKPADRVATQKRGSGGRQNHGFSDNRSLRFQESEDSIGVHESDRWSDTDRTRNRTRLPGNDRGCIPMWVEGGNDAGGWIPACAGMTVG